MFYFATSLIVLPSSRVQCDPFYYSTLPGVSKVRLCRTCRRAKQPGGDPPRASAARYFQYLTSLSRLWDPPCSVLLQI